MYINLNKMANTILKTKKTDRELCKIIATSVTDIVRNSLNPTFRQNYFNIIKVTNSTDAQNLVENELLNLLGENNISREKYNVKNDKLSIEHYIASKILRSSDAANMQIYSVMISLIQHLLQIDSKLDKQMKNNLNLVSTNIVPCDILESVESTSKNKQTWTNMQHKKPRKE